MERIIECPSGFVGRARHFKAESAGILADARAIRSGRAADSILRACWLETIELGPYAFPRDRVDWQQVLACDRIFAPLMLRVATYGEMEELDVRCPSCGHKFVWDLPLLELPVRRLPDESVAKVAAGDNRFETELAGRKVRFKLMTGRDQIRAIEVLKGTDDVVVASMMTRVLDVDGVPKEELTAHLNDLSMGDVQDLIDDMDDVDGGVETAFDVYCPSCGGEWEIDLPLDLQRMFVPQKPNERRRRRRRRKMSARGTRPSEAGDGQALPRDGRDENL